MFSRRNVYPPFSGNVFPLTPSENFRRLGLKSSDHGDWDKVKIAERIENLRAAAGLTGSGDVDPAHQSLLPELSVVVGKVISKAWKEEGPRVMQDLRLTMSGCGNDSEHTARGVIRSILLAVIIQTDYRLKMFPEHCLSSAEDNFMSLVQQTKANRAVHNGSGLSSSRAIRLANPTVLEGPGGFKLKVIANVDYLTFAHGCSSQYATANGIYDHRFHRTLDESVLHLNLDRPVHAREEIRTTIIQAKSWSHSDTLKANVPKAILQSLILMKKAHRPAVSWCLSTSIKWYFGITWKEGKTGQRQCAWFCPPDLPLTTEEFDDGRLMEDRARTIHELLTIWLFTPPELLRDEIFLTRSQEILPE